MENTDKNDFNATIGNTVLSAAIIQSVIKKDWAYMLSLFP